MLAGHTLGGRYDVLELIASGGMGEVYRARDRELDELVALKVIRTDRADDDMVERFRHEVKLARRVTHVNVARTFELGNADGVIFYTMELVDGENLEQRLARQHRLPVAEAVGIACAVCDALIAAHAAGVIHRDIKPANVLVAADGRVVLADFGIAAAKIASVADPSGTPAYMAPEQARGEPATPATDVYAVGVVLYEMLSGQRAFRGTATQIAGVKEQVERLVPSGGDVSSELAEVVAHATTASLEQRTASATELRRALAPWATADMHASLPPRRSTAPALEERTIVVIAPHASPDDDRIHIAAEIHEQLLQQLARTTFRVLPRTEDTLSPARMTIRFALAEQLVMTMLVDGSEFSLVLPLAIEQIPRAVSLAAAALLAAIGETPSTAPQAIAATDLILRARQAARLGASATTKALEYAEPAYALAPNDPRINASLAILLSRSAFFTADPTGEVLRRAGNHVRAALVDRDLADAHLAAGHHELHTGDATIAAGHYRVAISRSPHSAEAHEHLGRVLIEAGYIDAAIARFEDAAAISPHYRNVQWEVARAMALEGRWDEHDRLVRKADMSLRPVAVARTAVWRGDFASVRAVRKHVGNSFEAPFVIRLFDVYLDNAWPHFRDEILAKVFEEATSSRRRKTFVAQLAAEAAGWVGEVETCIKVLEHATEYGLFDLHWLDHVPPLRVARGTPAMAKIRARVEARARGIYDALYGDHNVATRDTALATS